MNPKLRWQLAKVQKSLRKLTRSFTKSVRGNIIVTASLIAPVILGSGAVAVDYTIFYNQRAALQQAADVAALASVKELGLSGTTEELVKQVRISHAESAFKFTNELSSERGIFDVDVKPSKEDREVEVNLSYEWAPFLAHVFDYKVTPIKVSATANLAGESLTCIIGLMQPQRGLRAPKSSIHLAENAVIEADGCAVFSNSDHRFGLRADNASSLSASTICSAGGVLELGRGSSANFEPKPITGCPKIDDPLADREKPRVGSCDYNNLTVSSDEKLKRGVYCGGLKISGSAEAKLAPGIYIIKDGPLVVKDDAELLGEGVTFFLTGKGSTFEFEPDTSIDLVAAESGPTAGLLFFEDRDIKHSFSFDPFDLENIPEDVRVHKISSNDARNLLGTIYLPNSILLVDANAPVADASAYTAIITGRLWLKEGPVLTLNADYTDTQIPVPDGLLGTEPALTN